MHATGVVLEMNNFDEVILRSIELFLRYSFCDDIHIVVDAKNGITKPKLAEEFVIMYLVYSYPPRFVLILELCFFDKGLHEIFYVALFAHEDIESFLTC